MNISTKPPSSGHLRTADSFAQTLRCPLFGGFIALEVTRVKSSKGSLIDVMLTNRPRRFKHTSLIETGMSDCYMLILSLFRAFFKHISAKTIEYRNYSKFSPEAFLKTKNVTKVSSAIVNLNSMICFQTFSEQF